MKHNLRLAVLVLALVAALSACSAMRGNAAASPSAADSGGQAETYENPNYYYLFDDILIPNVMEHAPDDDYSFETQQFKAGIQNFEGRVVFDDLINFFLNNMVKDGWRKVTTVRSKKCILVFEKTNKAAIIELSDGWIKARATVFAIEYKRGGAVQPAPSASRPDAVERYSEPTAPHESAPAYGEKELH